MEILKPITSELKENESIIGKQLNQASKKAWLNERELGACPKCGGGKLVILHSKKTEKRFVGCTNYFEGKCSSTFPLPQVGTIKPLSSTCATCGCPIIYIFTKGKKPWKLCINPSCPSKREQKQ